MLPHPSLRIFTFSELRAATRNFRNDTVVGEGGFGKVYKGWLDSKSGSTVVAVKKLNSESLQGFQEWQVFLRLARFFVTKFIIIRIKLEIGCAVGGEFFGETLSS